MVSLQPFLLNLRHIQHSGLLKDPAYEAELFAALKQTEAGRSLGIFDTAFSFVLKCGPDIQKLETAAKAHLLLNQILLRNARPPTQPPSEQFQTVEQLVAFCEANPPVFHTDLVVSDFVSAAGFRPMPNFAAFYALSIDSDGRREAILRCMTVKGDYYYFSLVSPIIHRFSFREYLLFAAVAKHIHSHPSSWVRPHIVSYPRMFLIHVSLAMVDNSGMSTIRDLARPIFVPGRLVEARRAVSNPDDSPRSISDSRRIAIDSKLLLQRFVTFASGNRNNFITLRQHFASFFACFSAFHAIFNPAPTPIEPFVFFENRQTMCIPGFLEGRGAILTLPLTPQVETFLPKYVLKGPFAATWHTIMTALCKHTETVQILIGTLLPKGLPPRKRQMPAFRLLGMALQINEATEKFDDPFQFALLDHLIECSQNVFQSRLARVDWI
jgi:hypothetical protein